MNGYRALAIAYERWCGFNCWIGNHAWMESAGYRECACCPRRQIHDGQAWRDLA